MDENIVIPVSFLAFFVWIWLMMALDNITASEYYAKKWDMMIECVKQWMAYDAWDCIPYRNSK